MHEDDNSKRFAMPESTTLTAEQKQELGKKALDDLAAMRRDRSDWLTRQEYYLHQWDDFVSPNRTGPWNDSSNFHIPFIMEQCRGFHARFMALLFDFKPYFHVRVNEQSDVPKKEFVQTLMQWALENRCNRNEGIQPQVDLWLWNCVTKGRGVGRLTWEEMRETYPDIQQEVDPETGEVVREEEVMKEGDIVYAGPRFENIDMLHFYIPAGSTVETADPLIARLFWSKDHMRRLSQTDRFYTTAIQDVIEKYPASERQTNSEEAGVEMAEDNLEGIDSVDSDLKREMYQVLECWTYYDVNGDGIDEKIVLWVHEDSGTVLGWNYAYKITKDGRPPYFTIDFIPRKNIPLGLVEMLRSINDEIDAIHNMRMDCGTMQNVPWGTIRESKALKSDDVQISPGYFLPVQEHDDIQIKSVPANQNFFVREEEMIIRHGELLGMSSLGFGQTPNKVGSLGTASGTSMMLGEMNRILNVHLLRIQQGWKLVLRHMYELLRDRLPLDTAFRITGEDGRDVFGRLENRNLFAANVDFDFSANAASMNRELEKQMNLIWLQTASNPLMVQLGLSTPRTIKAAMEDVAKSLGKKGIDNYVESPELAPRPQTLEEEVNFILQGIKPVIVLNDDHAAKVNGLVMHRDSPMLSEAGVQDPNALNMIIAGFNAAIQEHQQFAEAIQAQAAASNISGLEIAPTAMNREAGSTTTADSPAGEGAPLGGGAGALNPGITGDTPVE